MYRKPSAEFSAELRAIPGNAESLIAGDFNGDGRDDVVSQEPALAFGVTRVRIHYYDEFAAPAHTWTSTKLVIRPKVHDLTADGRA